MDKNITNKDTDVLLTVSRLLLGKKEEGCVFVFWRPGHALGLKSGLKAILVNLRKRMKRQDSFIGILGHSQSLLLHS